MIGKNITNTAKGHLTSRRQLASGAVIIARPTKKQAKAAAADLNIEDLYAAFRAEEVRTQTDKVHVYEMTNIIAMWEAGELNGFAARNAA